jgi:HK97 family phage portal protein
MKLTQKIMSRFGYEKRATTSNPSQWLIDWVTGGKEVSSGVSVSEKSALEYTPFWDAVRIISGTIASLPFIVYRRTKEGKDRETNHIIYELMHNRPNPYMDSLTFIETRQAHVLTYGNGYAEIQRDGAGRPVALWPLLPDRTFRMISDNGVPYYEVRQLKGGTVPLPDYDVLHIKGLGFDAYTGYNVVSYHKEAIGYGIAVKEFGGRFFGNDASPGGVLEHPQTLSDPARKNIEESWNRVHKGLSHSHRLAILEEGMKWNKIGVDPEQAQALETQKYTVDDCSRIFSIPPHKLGSMERATFSNIEEQNIDFVCNTMLYWFRKWEQECNYKLFSQTERKTMFCEILAEGLLRGKTLTRYQAYNIGRNAGFLSANDIRRLENMNSIGEKGDIYLEPLNTKPAGTETPPRGDEGFMRKAHRDLILSQLLRVIRKDFKTFEARRNFAKTILYEPVNAYASTLSGNMEVRTKLDNTIDELIGSNLSEDDAEQLADRIVDIIGGNHNAITKA